MSWLRMRTVVCVRVCQGYRTVRGTHGVSEGDFYFEVRLAAVQPEKAHVRIGWITDSGDLQAPVGWDRFGYAYRDVEGTKFHQSTGKSYGKSFGTLHPLILTAAKVTARRPQSCPCWPRGVCMCVCCHLKWCFRWCKQDMSFLTLPCFFLFLVCSVLSVLPVHLVFRLSLVCRQMRCAPRAWRRGRMPYSNATSHGA